MRELILEYLELYESGDTRLSPEEVRTKKRFNGGKEYPHVKTSTTSSHTRYKGVAQYDSDTDEKYHPEHNGVTHEVEWQSAHHTPESLSKEDKAKTLSHALALHHNYIENHTKPGDVVTNTPSQNKADTGVDKDYNKRAEIYRRKAGFAAPHSNAPQHHQNRQFGIVRQYPQDHKDESKRGKNYLEPIHEPTFDSRHSKIGKTLAQRRLMNTEIDED